MTWSIVSSPSVATELYHVTDTGNNFGFLFASLLFSIAASVIVFLLFLSFNPILMEEATVDFSKLPPCWMLFSLLVLPIWRPILIYVQCCCLRGASLFR